MDLLGLINPILTVIVAYVSVRNSDTLFKAFLYYIIGGIIIKFILNKIIGEHQPDNIVSFIATIGVAYIFYTKFKLAGAIVSLTGLLLLALAGIVLLALVGLTAK
jgi:hypothetical protein